MEENLKRIEELKTFMGGYNKDVPVFPEAIEHMKYIVEQCETLSLPQPEIFPWIGGNGVQAEWEFDWYLEIDSCDEGISILFVKGKEYDKSIQCKFCDIADALCLAREFIKNVVDINGTRR